MQDDSILAYIGKPAAQAKAYYRDIQKKIELHESIEKMREQAVDEELNWDDAAKMKKLLRNRDGSMETKSLKEKVQEVIKKDLQKADEKKIIVGGGNGSV
jgi:putative IMPACT (imprinted ancient) family translation regulator